MREIEVDYMNINEVFSGLDKLFAENRLPEVEIPYPGTQRC